MDSVDRHLAFGTRRSKEAVGRRRRRARARADGVRPGRLVRVPERGRVRPVVSFAVNVNQIPAGSATASVGG